MKGRGGGARTLVRFSVRKTNRLICDAALVLSSEVG